jgi:flavin-binding protein dodecin
VSVEKQAVFFNAVPLFVLAAAYLLVGAALVPPLWRERARVTVADLALALIFPCVGAPAAIFGVLVLVDREPIGGHVWASFVGTLVALVPAVLFLLRWRERGVLTIGPRAREAEELVSARDRELEAVAAISNALARAHKTVRNLDWFEVTEIRGWISGGEVGHFQVAMKIGFRLED